MPSYSFETFLRHTEAIRKLSAEMLEKHRDAIAGGVSSFDDFFNGLDPKDKTGPMVVRRLLATKFFNHWLAMFLLIESGLTADAFLCERSAMETLAFHWLLCLDPAVFQLYIDDELPRPVEVRKRLEKLGADVSYIRTNYEIGSGYVHAGRAAERFTLRMENQGVGTLMIGGSFSATDADHLLSYLPAILYLFLTPLMSQVSENPA